MSSAYQLKPWTSVVTPHLDILEGRLDSSTYASISQKRVALTARS